MITEFARQIDVIEFFGQIVLQTSKMCNWVNHKLLILSRL